MRRLLLVGLAIVFMVGWSGCGDDVAPNNDSGVGEDAGEDAGQEDAGETDAGETDAGETDAGETDAGETDAGETDAGETDAGETDAGETDAGETDGGETDGGETDAGETDAGETDAGETDGGQDGGSDQDQQCQNDADCDDQNPCTDDVCNLADGTCANPPVAAGTPCAGTDSDFCTSSCDAGGACDDSAPVSCDDSADCTQDLCDSSDGSCTNPPVAAGTPCGGSDSNFCTSTCDAAGACDDGVPVVCADFAECTTDVCDPVDGACSNPPLAAGTPCAGADSDYCNSSCDGFGVCDDSAPTTCDDSEECTTDSCNSSTGVCSNLPVAVDTPCAGSDGNLCTSTCNAAGVCDATAPVSCSDGQDCTGDVCDPADGSCTNPPAPVGTPCAGIDSDYCNSTCDAAGLCDETAAVLCQDTEECTSDACDPADGSCSFTPLAVGTACAGNDANYCNSTCDALGICDEVVPVSCVDGQECTSDICDPLDGSCTNSPLPLTTPCAGSDSDYCNSTCDGFGACDDSTAVSCLDGQDCTHDLCEPANGSCSNPPAAPGTPCAGSDSDYCNSTCDAAGACDDGAPLDCDDSQECTSDSCDPNDGHCTYTPVALGTPCAGNDSNYCSSTCDAAGFCDNAAPVSCDDFEDCTGDACDTSDGHCEFNPVPIGTPCAGGDPDFCNSTCDAAGTCSATPVSCDDSLDCTDDDCETSDGSCTHAPVADGTPCNGGDGDYCNSTCSAGACDGSAPVTCDDLEECTGDACDTSDGHCEFTPVVLGTPCDGGDANYCNSTCDAAGTCDPSTPVTCDDSETCTTDNCNAFSGACSFTPVAVGTPCLGGDADICNSSCAADGTCDPATPVVCDDGLFCNGAESCDSVSGCQAGTDPCDDNWPCTLNNCDEGADSCSNPPDHAVCDNSLYCDGAEQCDPAAPGADPVGCIDGAPPVCDNPDPCISSTCIEAPPGCQETTTDEDGDGQHPEACGGTDCDDLNPDTYLGAPEICDAEDNDCDTEVDEDLVAYGDDCLTDADCCSQNCINDLCDFPVGACQPPFYECAGPAECCSGVCGPDLAGIDRCQSESICRPTGADCTWAIECCSMLCQAGLCATGGMCAPDGAACSVDEDCCENYCNGGFCESTGGFCTTLGEPCSSPGNCCSNVCTEVSPTESRCNFYAECRDEGDHCTVDEDCCNCMCESDGLCGSPGSCSTAYESCTGGGECCSRLCVNEPSGTGICRFISGCISEGELCDPTCPRTCAACCSGECEIKTTGGLTTSRCVRADNCLAAGNVCGGSGTSNCCEGDSAQCRLTRTGITRCWGDVLPGECLADGTPCAFSDQCCNEYCISDGSGNLFCQSGCSQLGEPCTASADCCADPVILACQDCVCVESDLPCVDIGMPCNTTDECCYGVCDDGYCLML